MFEWLKNPRKYARDGETTTPALVKVPPLTTFRGWLRNHKPTRNNIWGNAVFNLAFPGFAPPDWTEEKKRESLARVSPHLDHLFFQPSQHRRWGGYELDRGCYYSVSRDGSGDDAGTLSAELNAYRDFKRQDMIVSATDSSAFSDKFFDGLPAALREVRNSCVLVSVFPASRLRSAYEETQRALDPQALEREEQLSWLTEENLVHVMVLPLVQWQEIPNVVDLRLPQVRQAFFDIFRTGTAIDQISDPGSRTASYSRPMGDNIQSFGEMIPEFIDPSLGGTDQGEEGITQMIGAYLRNSGAAGLIYPSARNDCGVEFANGKMTDHWGWNFVDYRTSKPSFLAAHSVTFGPWRQTGLKGLSVQAPAQGDFAGSLATRGVRSANDGLYEDQYGEQRNELMAKLRSGPPVVVLLGSTNLDELK